MASAQDTLFELFVEIAGDRTPAVSPLAIAGQGLASVVREVTQQIASAVVPAGGRSGGAREDGGGVVGVLEAVGSTLVKNAFGAAPLIRGIFSLFDGGGDSEAALPPLVKFALPPALQFSAAD